MNAANFLALVCNISSKALPAGPVADRLQVRSRNESKFFHWDFDELILNRSRAPHRA